MQNSLLQRKFKNKQKLQVVATSSSMADLQPSLISIGEKRFSSIGFEIKYGKNVQNNLFHISGSVHQRTSDFMEAIYDKNIYGVLSVYGGYNSNQLLPLLDYKAISNTQKPIIGYSDFTAILNAVAARGGAAFHGPSFASFCDPNMFEYTQQNFQKALEYSSVIYRCNRKYASDLWFTKPNLGPREIKNIDQWRVYREGETEGNIYGGNIDTFCMLLGTPYLPNLQKSILFLEDTTGNNPGCFHRFMTQLQQNNIFSMINGLIIGKFPFGSKLDNFELLSYILSDVLDRKTDIPVLCDVFCSHVDPIATFPLGKRTLLRACRNSFIKINIPFGD